MERRLIWLFVVTVAVGGCEQLSPEMQLIHDAATALGGVEAVEQVATLRIEGSGNNFRLGQNPTPNAPLPRPRSNRTSWRPISGITACGGRLRAPISPGG